MRHLESTKAEAIELRAKHGLSIDELAARFGVSRSTVYYWVRDVAMKQEMLLPIERLERRQAQQRVATAAMQAKYAALRQAAYEATYKDAQSLLEDPSIRDFVVLYLAEGYRKDRNSVSFTNSNPGMIRFAFLSMHRLATNPHFRYSFQFHADQNPEQLRVFWSSLLDLDPAMIQPISKTNSGQLKGRRFACEHGIFQIQVSDTLFRSRLQALMDAVQEEWRSSK